MAWNDSMDITLHDGDDNKHGNTWLNMKLLILNIYLKIAYLIGEYVINNKDNLAIGIIYICIL